MRLAPPRSARRVLAFLGAVSLLALSGCAGGDTDEKFAPACPKPVIPTDFNDLHRFRGAGRDITDSVLEGRIVEVRGSCTRGDGGTNVTTITVGLDLVRGPAATGRTADVSYFVAVSKDDQIFDKQVFHLAPEFASNADRLSLLGEKISVIFPGTSAKTPSAYRVVVGFDLTPAELAENRRRLDRR